MKVKSALEDNKVHIFKTLKNLCIFLINLTIHLIRKKVINSFSAAIIIHV